MGASACSACGVETVNSKDVEIKDGQGKVLRCISLETKRPDFLADAIPCATRSLQGSDPTQWAMTNVQLLELFNYMQSTQEYKAAKETRGHVCLYDVNSLFVIPWSRGFGCGVALLMNAQGVSQLFVLLGIPNSTALGLRWGGALVLHLCPVSARGWCRTLSPTPAEFGSLQECYSLQARAWHAGGPHYQGRSLRSIVVCA